MAEPQMGARLVVPPDMEAPYIPQSEQEVASLLRDLETAVKQGKRKQGFSVKKTNFAIANSPSNITVSSWRMQDWDYKRPDLPTYARGLFTTKTSHGRPEIVVRGYDKFFNTDEVPATKWSNILGRTKGPYELTLKENGCIIFVSGLEDDTLLVCSKHSTGDRGDIAVSHASAGEVRLERQLAAMGKTKSDLARELRKRNVTAVAELCDDTFEEHILAYEGDKAGLYLHGMNLNLPYFRTYPSPLVQSFAREWGFKEVGLMVMDDINQVKSFLEQVAETGAHNGRDVEGFVIRCKMTTDGRNYDDWFFKFKFEEPYLMYRQWRECTKALIAGKPPRFKKHQKITEEYLLYARRRLADDRKLGAAYNQNHGIIALRNDFLKFKNLKGSEAATFEEKYGETEHGLARGGDPEVTGDVILVPISTLGCGKTTLGLALTHLFGWGHIQNDNITGSQRPPRFTKMVLDQLNEHPVVFADRNNTERRERKQIINDVKMQHTRARLVALAFSHEDMANVRRVTMERVLARGDNHQTIQAASDAGKVRGIMENFLRRFEPCDPEREPDSGFDAVIDLDPAQGSRKNLEIVVEELHRIYPQLVEEVPTAEMLDEAIQYALEGYKPELRHQLPDRSGKRDKRTANENRQSQQGQVAQGQKVQPVAKAKKKPLEYVGVDVPTKEIQKILETAFDAAKGQKAVFFKQLQHTRRVQPRFHVTLMHRSGAKEHGALWEKYTALQNEAEAQADREKSAVPELGGADVVLERIVWDQRIMAIVARVGDGFVNVYPPAGGDGAAANSGQVKTTEKMDWECVNRVAHVTVGTRDDGVKPKESNDLLARWLDQGIGEATGIMEIVLEGRPTIKGTVRGVLSM
jgi:tRNA ligase